MLTATDIRDLRKSNPSYASKFNEALGEVEISNRCIDAALARTRGIY